MIRQGNFAGLFFGVIIIASIVGAVALRPRTDCEVPRKPIYRGLYLMGIALVGIGLILQCIQWFALELPSPVGLFGYWMSLIGLALCAWSLIGVRGIMPCLLGLIPIAGGLLGLIAIFEQVRYFKPQRPAPAENDDPNRKIENIYEVVFKVFFCLACLAVFVWGMMIFFESHSPLIRKIP